MKGKNSKRFVLIHVSWMCFECVCVRARVPTVLFRPVFALVDSTAATFITSWENVMR